MLFETYGVNSHYNDLDSSAQILLCCSKAWEKGTEISLLPQTISTAPHFKCTKYRPFTLKITVSFREERYCRHGRHYTAYPKKYAHGFCFAVLCCGYTLTDFPISIRLTSLALWQSNDCPSASKATLMNMDKYFMWIHYERLHNHK